MAAPAPVAAERRGPCLIGERGGPSCVVWNGFARGTPDGDTPYVSVEGAGLRYVRMTGIQAMENGDCHAAAATARLRGLIRATGGRVRLAARRASSTSGGRPRRAVAGRIGGRWVDFGAVLLREGHALWSPNPVEDAWNASYNRLAQRAARAKRRLWNPRACAPGPVQAADLRVGVQWDADGDDRTNLNGEYVRVTHRGGGGPVRLSGWHVRDATLRRFVFPRGTVLRPGRSVTVHVGRGDDLGARLFWGLRSPVFEAIDNPNTASQGMGDGAYLFDPHGDLRASSVYPCRHACANPARGRVQMTVNYRRADEYVLLRNVSAAPVDLDGQVVKTSMQRSYDLGARGLPTVLAPGETLRLDTGGDPAGDTRLRRHWGLAPPVLDDRGAGVALLTLTGLPTACYAWGAGRCPTS